jgi:hypothetical protein
METLWILLLGFLLRPKLGIGLGLLLVVIGLCAATRLQNRAVRERDAALGQAQFRPENMKRDAQGRLIEPDVIEDPRNMDSQERDGHLANSRMLACARYGGYVLSVLGGALALVCLGRWLGLIPMPAIPEEPKEEKPHAKQD